MAEILDRLLDVAEQAAGFAVKGTSKLVNCSKEYAETCSLQNKLSRLYRQLGALDYSLHLSGRKDPEMRAWYYDEISRIKARLDELQLQETNDFHVAHCSHCGTGVKKDAIFCRNCGTKLP